MKTARTISSSPGERIDSSKLYSSDPIFQFQDKTYPIPSVKKIPEGVDRKAVEQQCFMLSLRRLYGIQKAPFWRWPEPNRKRGWKSACGRRLSLKYQGKVLPGSLGKDIACLLKINPLQPVLSKKIASDSKQGCKLVSRSDFMFFGGFRNRICNWSCKRDFLVH